MTVRAADRRWQDWHSPSRSWRPSARARTLPAAPIWTYQAPRPTDFFSAWVSSAQRLANGDTLFVDATRGELLEVTAAGETVWRYVSPVGTAGPKKQGTTLVWPAATIYKARRYAPDHAGLAGRDLTPRGTVELPAP